MAALASRPTDSARPSAAAPRTRDESIVERVGDLVEVPGLETPLDPARVDLDAQDRRTGHRRRERLGATHASEAGGQDGAAAEVSGAEVLLARGCEGLVRALQDPLRPDVDPAPCGHLPEHRQAFGLEPAELVPGRPARHEERVRDEDTRRPLPGPEHRDGFAALDEQGLVGPQAKEGADDLPKRVVTPCGAARSPVDDEALRVLRDLGIEVVEQHPERCLGIPAQRIQ